MSNIIKIGNEDVNFKVGSGDCKIYLGDVQMYPHIYENDYLTFTATNSGTFKFSGNSINYSIDSGLTWNTLASNTNTPTIAAGDKIMWKASGLTPTSNAGIGTFSSTANFTVEGNVMSLYYGDNFVNQTSLSGKSNAFRWLFSGCTRMTSAENIVLPATTLELSCYNRMFYGCTNLTTVPNNLLPATIMAETCYSNMFYGCTSLTVAPQLQSTSLAKQCYYQMFYQCSSLTTAPELPAATVTYQCYFCMFYQCNKLNYIKCLATDISASNCTSNWVTGVASAGTFVKAVSMTGWTTGNSGIPSGWAVVNA